MAERPDARVAIVVANLHERRSEVVALAEEILCPELLLALQPDAPRPYGISLGEQLSSVPIVACALALIAVASGPIEAATAAALVRAPFLPDADAHWMRRAGVEEAWRKVARRDVGWFDIVAALSDVDPALHRQFSAAALPSRVNRLPRDWARAWSEWLAATGWPGTAPLTSAQWQARDAWSDVVAKFAATGAVTGASAPSARSRLCARCSTRRCSSPRRACASADSRQPGGRRTVVRLRVARGLRRRTLAACRDAQPVPAAPGNTRAVSRALIPIRRWPTRRR